MRRSKSFLLIGAFMLLVYYYQRLSSRFSALSTTTSAPVQSGLFRRQRANAAPVVAVNRPVISSDIEYVKQLEAQCRDWMRLLGDSEDPCNGAANGRALADILDVGSGSWTRSIDGEHDGIHLVLQVPFFSEFPTKEWRLRQKEYIGALYSSLKHGDVAIAHVLTENVLSQLLLYSSIPDRVHHKIRTVNLNHRITYADAVRYANDRLNGTVVLIQTSDVSVAGDSWKYVNVNTMDNQFFGLTRHELPDCGMSCDCLKAFDGCHDGFLFKSPLKGGDELLEAVSFRIGGLWGSENRFMYEVQQKDTGLKFSNPCKTLRLEHLHCQGKGMFRPKQDQRRINENGRSMEPPPRKWRLPRKL